jgi:heme exporter protein A
VSLDFDRVEVSEVSRHYGRRRAVSRLSMTVRQGDILGLLGPNGAGKSTLLGMLATLVTPTTGAILYGGFAAAVANGPHIRRQIGLLAHELHLYPELTARQNLDFFARLYGVSPAAAVPGALASAGLADRADDEVAAFSRGMRQRLALERALLHGPRLLLLDEPFTGLDDRSALAVTDRLKRLAAGGAILIVATHDLEAAEGLLTRVAVLREGRLICDEPATAGLRRQYRSAVGAN